MAICRKVQRCKELLNIEELIQRFKPTNYYDFQITLHFVTDFFSFSFKYHAISKRVETLNELRPIGIKR